MRKNQSKKRQYKRLFYSVSALAAKNAAGNAASATLQIKGDANGQYAVKYIRADFLLQAYDGSCYLDIASVGFAG